MGGCSGGAAAIRSDGGGASPGPVVDTAWARVSRRLLPPAGLSRSTAPVGVGSVLWREPKNETLGTSFNSCCLGTVPYQYVWLF